MEERDAPREAVARGRVEQRHALRRERLEIPIDARRAETQVVQALAALLEKSSDARFAVARLEQLDLAVAGGEQRRAHALIGKRGLSDEREAERVAPEVIRLV